MANYKLRAKDVMQVEVATIVDNATITEAAQHMRLEGVRSLVVERRNEDDPYGIVTFSDIVIRVLAEGRDPDKVRVHEVMTRPIITLYPGMEVQYIAQMFRQTGVSHLPVLDDGKIKGIISMTDLVTEMIAEPD